VSDDILSIVPTDPWWQPDEAAGQRAEEAVRRLVPTLDGYVEPEFETTWSELVQTVDCGENLSRITCSHCAGELDVEWFRDLGNDGDGELTTLDVVVPCCSAATTLDALEYDWQCAFARFEIAVWNPSRPNFDAVDLAAVAQALGHAVTQVRAHI
jgi:hypothetical protein